MRRNGYSGDRCGGSEDSGGLEEGSAGEAGLGIEGSVVRVFRLDEVFFEVEFGARGGAHGDASDGLLKSGVLFDSIDENEWTAAPDGLRGLMQ